MSFIRSGILRIFIAHITSSPGIFGVPSSFRVIIIWFRNRDRARYSREHLHNGHPNLPQSGDSDISQTSWNSMYKSRRISFRSKIYPSGSDLQHSILLRRRYLYRLGTMSKADHDFPEYLKSSSQLLK